MFQLVDDIKVPVGFDPDRVRSSLEYKASAGDIFIDTFPKCGTNWTKRIVQVLVGRESTEDSDYALSTTFLEMVGKEVIESLPQPRIITSHLQCQWLNKHPQAKYIYVLRNPKDCCMSYYHHAKNTKGYNFQDGTINECVDLFVKGELSFGDYFSHLLSWYPNVHNPNVLFLTYESMNKDRSNAVKKIARFLEVKDPDLLNPESSRFKRIVDLIGISSMREYLAENYKKAMGGRDLETWTPQKHFPVSRAPPPPDAMVRKGVVGDWRNYLNKEQSIKIEKAFFERCGDVVNHVTIWDPKDWLDNPSSFHESRNQLV